MHPSFRVRSKGVYSILRVLFLILNSVFIKFFIHDILQNICWRCRKQKWRLGRNKPVNWLKPHDSTVLPHQLLLHIFFSTDTYWNKGLQKCMRPHNWNKKWLWTGLFTCGEAEQVYKSLFSSSISISESTNLLPSVNEFLAAFNLSTNLRMLS